MNWYKRHIGDYIKDAAHLSLLEHGVYSRLLDVYYTRESGIPDDQAARLIGARTKEEREALTAVLNEFFQLNSGLWIQGRCESEIHAAGDKAQRNREVGKLGGRPKLKGSNEKPTNNPDGFNSETHSEPNNNPSQTPEAISHKPEPRSQESEGDARGNASPSAPPRPKPADRATRIPDDFGLTDERKAVAEAEKLNADRTFAKFVDYWRAASGAKARKVDWEATWRNWCRSEADRNRPVNGGSPQHKTKFDLAMEALDRA